MNGLRLLAAAMVVGGAGGSSLTAQSPVTTVTRPDTTELTLFGLSTGAEPADVARVLGRPDSVHSYADPLNVGGRLQTLHYPQALVYIGFDGLKIGVKLIAAGPATRRRLAVGDSVGRAVTLYGPPDTRTANELRWRIRGHDHLVVEVRDGLVASIFAGFVDPTNRWRPPS
jgi:hypothetical protein